MADNRGKRSRRKAPSVRIPDEADANYRPNPTSRPGSTRKKASRPNTAKGSRPNTAKSKSSKKVSILVNGAAPKMGKGSKSSSYASSPMTSNKSSLSPLSHNRGLSGQMGRKVIESMYPPPVGQKHGVMGLKVWEKIPNKGNIQSCTARGAVHLLRKIHKTSNYSGGVKEEEQREISAADEHRLSMMANYFSQKIDEYKENIAKCKEDARRKREATLAAGQTAPINQLVPFDMSKKFYNMMEADISQVYIAYRRLSSTRSTTKKMGSYDHIMYDDHIKEGLVQYGAKFVHLVCKPYQCWMNLFNIHETSARQLSEVALLVLEHFNKVGRYRQAFPQWLIDLRGWEHSIAHKYLISPVHVFEVLEHIKDGSYWARYAQYLREENDEVYYAKWNDGTDYFPHKQNEMYWYFGGSQVDHWMTLQEYRARKSMKKSKSKRKSTVHGGNDGDSYDERQGHPGSSASDDDDDELDPLDEDNNGGGSGHHGRGRRRRSGKRSKGRKGTRSSIEDDELSTELRNERSDGMEDDASSPERNEDEIYGGLEYLRDISVSDSDQDEDLYSSSASDDSIPVNPDIYRCPQPYDPSAISRNEDGHGIRNGIGGGIPDDAGSVEQMFVDADDEEKERSQVVSQHMSVFAGWTAFHRSFVGFISRELLDIDASERTMARSASEDHWRRRHLHMGNGCDLPICQYRLITKKLNLEHVVTENLRMIAVLKNSSITVSAPLTQQKYLPDWVRFKAQKAFNEMFQDIRRQQLAYSPQKAQLLETLRAEIQIRTEFNQKIRESIARKKMKLTSYLSRLQMLYERQMGLLDYIVTAKHRVANAKLKVAYARKQVQVLENDVQQLREMTPREQEFARRNKHYYEAVSTKKLCKEYHTLKRNNYDPNKQYLRTYRRKIKRLLKGVALYNLWFWSLKQRYQTHKKWEVLSTAYEQVNPTSFWDPALRENDGGSISELLLSQEKRYRTLNEYDPHKMRKEQYILRLREEERKENELAEHSNEDTIDGDDGDGKTVSDRMGKKAQIERDQFEFERLFERKKEAANHFASMSMGNATEQQAEYNRIYNVVLSVMDKYRDDEMERGTRPQTRQSMMSRSARRRISESELPGIGARTQSEFSRMSKHGARDSMTPEQMAQLAGAPRQYNEEDEFQTDEDYDEEDDDWYDSQNDGSFESDEEGFDEDDGESYDDDDDGRHYEDEDGVISENAYDSEYRDEDGVNMQPYTFRHATPTAHFDEATDSDICTEHSDEDEDPEHHGHHRRDVSKMLTGSELGDDDHVEYDGGSMSNMHMMGASTNSINGFGGNQRAQIRVHPDEESGSESFESEDDESYYLSEEGVGDTDYDHEEEYSNSSGGGDGAESDADDFDDDEYSERARLAGVPLHGVTGNESFSVAGGLHSQRSYSTAGGMNNAPPMDYYDESDSYEDDEHSDDDQ